MNKLQKRAARLWVTVAVAGILTGCNSQETTASAPPTEPPPTTNKTAPQTTAPASKPQKVRWTSLPSAPQGESSQAASADYLISLSEDRGVAVVRGIDDGVEVLRHEALAGFEIGNVLLDAHTLLVVNSDPLEEKDDVPVLIDLPSGKERSLPRGAPPAWKGLWSLGKEYVTYGARGDDGTYCVARVAVDTLEGQVESCAPPRHGMNQAEQSPFGLTILRFDDKRPLACGTALVSRGAAELEPLKGTPECVVWESVALAGDGAIWASVTDGEKIEVADIDVRLAGEDPESLGEGTTGSLTWCGDSVWFLRQQQGLLMRWTPGIGLSEAFKLDEGAGTAVLSTPVCSGDAITITEARAVSGSSNEEIVHFARVS